MAAHAPTLPDDVLVNILLRLPARSVGRFRAVCKAWRAATTLPSFDRAHAARPAAVAKVASGYGYVLYRSEIPVVVGFEFYGGRWRREGGPFARAISFVRTQISTCRVLGSWDGVLCLQPYTAFLWPNHPEEPARDDELLLWNPLTNAFTTVLAPAAHGRVIGGYAHPVTGRFHLLHSEEATLSDHQDLRAPITFQILRVGDANWREVPWEDRLNIFMKSDGDRSVSLNGILHWLVQSATERVMVLMFDMAREEFRFMEGPARPGMALQTTRTVLSNSKLCILTLAKAPSPCPMEMWVLNDHSDPQTWQLKEKIRMVRFDGTDLSPWFTCAAAKVEVVEDGNDGEEILLRLEDRIDAYNFQEKVWRKMSITKGCCVVMHRESVLQPEISFGEQARVLRTQRDIFGRICYCV